MRIWDPGMETIRIRDGHNSDPGWKNVGPGIRDKHPGSATLGGDRTLSTTLPPYTSGDSDG
jgi:hypothetical protein